MKVLVIWVAWWLLSAFPVHANSIDTRILNDAVTDLFSKSDDFIFEGVANPPYLMTQEGVSDDEKGDVLDALEKVLIDRQSEFKSRGLSIKQVGAEKVEAAYNYFTENGAIFTQQKAMFSRVGVDHLIVGKLRKTSKGNLKISLRLINAHTAALMASSKSYELTYETRQNRELEFQRYLEEKVTAALSCASKMAAVKDVWVQAMTDNNGDGWNISGTYKMELMGFTAPGSFSGKASSEGDLEMLHWKEPNKQAYVAEHCM